MSYVDMHKQIKIERSNKVKDSLVIGQIECQLDKSIEEQKENIDKLIGVYKDQYLVGIQVYGDLSGK